MLQPGSDDLGRRTAENYQRFFVRSIGAPVAAQLVDRASLGPGERVLDAACGTGVVARLAAERVAPGGTVAGLDPNPAMLAVAEEATPVELGIEWHRASAEHIPLADGSFDAVLCGMGLQFFSDRDAGLREFHRVLGPGGRLVANVPGPIPPPFAIMADGLERHVGPASATFVRTVFALHDPDDLADLATRAGFEEVKIESAMISLELPPPAELLWQYVGSTPLAAAVEQSGAASRAALEREFTEKCRTLASEGPSKGAVRMTTLLARKTASHS